MDNDLEPPEKVRELDAAYHALLAAVRPLVEDNAAAVAAIDRYTTLQAQHLGEVWAWIASRD